MGSLADDMKKLKDKERMAWLRHRKTMKKLKN